MQVVYTPFVHKSWTYWGKKLKTIKTLFATALLTVVAIACVAQEDEAAPDVFTYASYFQCPGGPGSRVDELVAKDTERMDALVDDGTILRWGWLSHHTGGQWMRVFYHQANSIDALLDGSDAIAAADDDADDDGGLKFGQVCNSHDDYIWQVENGNSSDDRGAAGFSVYHVCDANREDRADEIMAETMAPILNKLVEDGDLTSWGWSSHVVGGKYRKLQTMTATDHKSLLAARGKAISLMYAEGSEAGEEFTDICGTHVDYMWDIVHEK